MSEKVCGNCKWYDNHPFIPGCGYEKLPMVYEGRPNNEFSDEETMIEPSTDASECKCYENKNKKHLSVEEEILDRADSVQPPVGERNE